ncbi:MAG: serine protease [Candidatus Omnitrophica bacterium]|nr:serine protease [Candidatus Omnitrophota bacterium]
MFKKISLITILLLCLQTFSFAARESTTLEKIGAYENAVVTVRAQTVSIDRPRVSISERSGAGVVIDPSGMIVTNTHIIYGSNIIKVILMDGTLLNAEVMFVSKEYDFSILKVYPGTPLTAIDWSDPEHLKLGQEIVTIGHSPLLDRTISGGQINGMGTRTLEDGSITPEVIEISINHYPGDSGGPVFDHDGRLVGLMNAKRTGVQRAAFAIPSSKIHLEYLKLVNPSEKQ